MASSQPLLARHVGLSGCCAYEDRTKASVKGDGAFLSHIDEAHGAGTQSWRTMKCQDPHRTTQDQH